MSRKREGFLRRGGHYLVDGTFQEVFEAIRKKDHPDDKRQWEYDQHGFRTLKNEAFVTHKIDTYIKLIKNAEEWQEFDAKNMDRFFRDAIELFPYDRRATPDASNKGTHFAPPIRFFRVQQEMIQRRFPWGRNFTPGDADLRDNVETLRYIFSKNFFFLILRRRKLVMRYVLLGLLALLISYAFMLVPSVGAYLFHWEKSQPLNIGGAAVVCVVALGVFRALYARTLELIQNYRDQYQAAIQSSCLVLGRNLQVRQQDIIALIPLIFREADDDKFSMMSEGRLDKWPEEARKWTKLAFWMAGRVEYNELSMQLHMWRIRRLHFGLQWLATLLTTLVAIVSFTLLGAAALLFLFSIAGLRDVWTADPQTFKAICAAGLLATLGCGLYVRQIVKASDKKYRVELDLIEKNIMTKTIQGHTDVNLHDIVAQRLFIEKSALLYEEAKAKR